jgi:hypothetical protein
MLATRLCQISGAVRFRSLGFISRGLSTNAAMAMKGEGEADGHEAGPAREKNAKPRHRLVKKEKGQRTKIETIPTQNVFEAIELVKSKAWANFDETVDVMLALGVDPRKAAQSVKGVASLPHGNGKKVRIAVFATGSDASDAVAAGADVVGGEDLVARIQQGDIPFDRVIATPEMMPTISKIGKVRTVVYYPAL